MEIYFKILVLHIMGIFLSLLIGKRIILILRKKEIGQEIREDGPKAHLNKAGTPTMGGIIFVITTIVLLLFSRALSSTNLVILLGMLLFGGIGFIDDFLKLVMKRSLGLNEKQKIILQFIASIILIFACKKVMDEPINLQYIPFMTKATNFKFFIYPLLIFIIIGTVNATNLTDGLDGLCTSVSIPVFITLTIISIFMKSDSYYFTSILTGALIGFLVYNSYPAAVFMGDTGSMAIGGAIVSFLILKQLSIFLIILGGIYMVEVLSVIIQMLSYRYRNKKRVFLMSPIHHHFELKGYLEPKIVSSFTVISVVLSLITLLAFSRIV